MSDVQKADEDARLLVEAFCLGQQNPSIWEAYMTGWESDVYRRIRERFPEADDIQQAGRPDTITGLTEASGGAEHEGDA